jgi:hypothetical protein
VALRSTSTLVNPLDGLKIRAPSLKLFNPSHDKQKLSDNLFRFS